MDRTAIKFRLSSSFLLLYQKTYIKFFGGSQLSQFRLRRVKEFFESHSALRDDWPITPLSRLGFTSSCRKQEKNCIITTFLLVYWYFCAKCKREKSFTERKLEFLVCFFPSPLRQTNLSIKRLETRGRRCRDNFYVPSTSHQVRHKTLLKNSSFCD